MRRSIARAAVVALAAGMGLPALARAQVPDEYHNLEVLPEDITKGELLDVMKGFAIGLGVRCHYCHVGEEGMPFSEFDFESDEKATKRKARFMLQMVSYLNDERLPGLREVADRVEPPVSVSCQTCHHGVPVPRQIGDIVMNRLDSEGIEPALAEYRSLRQQFYGSASYDFGELPLLLTSNGLLQGGRTDEALALATLNLEYFPESVGTLMLIAQAHAARGERDLAVEKLEKVLKLQPGNPQAKRMLETVRASGS